MTVPELDYYGLGAGVLLNKKIGDPVRRGEVLFTIFAEKRRKLNSAVKTSKSCEVYGILTGKRSMLVETV